MPVQEVGFSEENKVASIFDMDMVRMETKGQKGRILIMDKGPKTAFVHFVKDNTGGSKGAYVVCLGDFDAMRKQGQGARDENCPFCKVAEVGRDVPVGMAQQRFMVHVVRYRTNNAGKTLMPVSLALELWKFGPGVFNKLIDRQQEHGDLRQHDIVLTCTNPDYQNFDIDVSAGSVLTMKPSDPKEMAQVQSALAQYKELQGQRMADLARAFGLEVNHETAIKMVSNALPNLGETDLADANAFAWAGAGEEPGAELAEEAEEPEAEEVGLEEASDEEEANPLAAAMSALEEPEVAPQPARKTATKAAPATKATASKPAAQPQAQRGGQVSFASLLD